MDVACNDVRNGAFRRLMERSMEREVNGDKEKILDSLPAWLQREIPTVLLYRFCIGW